MARWLSVAAGVLVLAIVVWLVAGSRGSGPPEAERVKAPTSAEPTRSVPFLEGDAAPTQPPAAPSAKTGSVAKATGPSVVLRILWDGKPALPERYSLRVENFMLLPELRTGPVEEDRARGELRFRMPQPVEDETLDVWFHAEEAWPASATATRSGDGFVADVHAERATFLIPRVTPDARRDVDVAMFSSERDRWESEAPPGYHGLLRREIGGRTALGPLRTGRYVLHDEASGLTSEPVDLVGGDPPREVALDVSSAGTVRGRVEIPATKAGLAEMTDVRIRVEGEGVLHLRPVTVGPDGTFEIGVPGDRRVTIRPWHPVLVPAPQGGVAVLTEPREGIVLRMVAENRCTFRPSPVPQSRPWFPAFRVLRFRGEPTQASIEQHAVTFDGTTMRFGGHPAGTWTLWIDMHGFAPAVLRDVLLGEGNTDLGEVPLPRGSGVRVRVLWNEPATPPPVIVSAEHLGVPAYRRVTEAQPDPFVTLVGLGAGRFRVEALDKGAVRRVEAEVVVDGTSDVEVSLDLRD